MKQAAIDPASFRDPSGYVFHVDGRVIRTVTPHGVADHQFVRESGLLARLEDEALTVGTVDADPDLLGTRTEDPGTGYVLEHPTLPFWSYPYEWTFPLLKAAALLHLDVHLKALQFGVTLSDASAYNVQFVGTRPVFIDILSFRRYREGELWAGYGQFCVQFLNPLLLRALTGIPHNHWYRGSLEGIDTGELARIVPFRGRLSWRVMWHVLLQGKLQKAALNKAANKAALNQEGRILRSAAARSLPPRAYRSMLVHLRRWIEKLQPRDSGGTNWRNYATTHTYSPTEEAAKHRFVAEFVSKTRPGLLLDLGCNTGDYAALALEAGADYVVGFDSDQSALEAAFARSEASRLKFLPLFIDAANPSPPQGWNEAERSGLRQRVCADALLALAFTHHLAIGRNIPLPQVVGWLVGLAPHGVIEFVQKTDPTIERMLACREDVFKDYSEEAFASAIKGAARIVRVDTVSSTGRRLYWYDRT